MLGRLVKNLFDTKQNKASIENSIWQKKLKEAYQEYQSDDLPAAEKLLQDILKNEPENADAWCLRGEIATVLHNTQAAIKYYRQAIQSNPNISEAHGNLGLLFYDLGDFDSAITCFERVIQMQPDNAKMLNNFGITLLAQGQYKEAEKKFKTALTVDSKLDAAWCNLGILAQRQLLTKEALNCFERALALNRDSAETHCNYGLTLREVERSDEAILHLQESVRIRPGYADAHSNLAIALQDNGEFEKARFHVEQALQLNPDHIEAQCNLVIILRNMGKIEEALATLERISQKVPDNPNVQMSKAYLFLLKWQFQEGWRLHEFRFKQEMYPRRNFPWPEWDGADLKNKRLLVFAEQGLGDEMMFANCFPDVISKAGHVIIECEPRLKELFARSYPAALIIGRQRNVVDNWLQSLPSIDYQVGAGSLPKFFRNSLESFPKHQGYLKADIEKVGYWKERLAGLGEGLKIGISWRGGLVKTGKIFRSINLIDLLPIFRLPNIKFINLQYGDCQKELTEFHKESGLLISHWPEAISDYDETAALIDALDVVVTVCTAVVHLSGALAKPVLVMAPYAAEWRYGAYDEKMPWYPSVKIFRQSSYGNWGSVIKEIEQLLKVMSREKL